MASKMKLIERAPDLRSQVYDRLRESIKNGEFPADGKLAEQMVAKDYGVSRTPAREALAMLVRDGLLVQEGRGFSIPPFSQESIFDVFEVRLCLEPQAIRRLTQRITAKQVRTIKGMIISYFTKAADPAEYASNLRTTRDQLFEMAGNERLRQTLKLYQDHVSYVAERTLIHGDWQAVSRERMRKMLEAIVAGDAEGAAAAMSEVLIAARDAIVATLDDSTPSVR